MYSIYRHTSPSGKVYIGMTKQLPEKRWLGGQGYRTQIRFYRAIQKYGWDNFIHEVLYENLSFEEAERKEREMISFHQSFDKRYGYNIERGGNCKKEVSEETLEKSQKTRSTEEYKMKMREVNRRRWSTAEAHEKMSNRFSGEGNPMYGKKLSDAHRRAFIDAGKNNPPPVMYGPDNPMYGKRHTDEVKAKISEANSGANNARARAVCCVETGIIYGCIRDASRATGIHFSSISKCCCGVILRAGGYHWRYVDEEAS